MEVGLVWCFGSSDDEIQVNLSLALTIRPRLVHGKEGREFVLLTQIMDYILDYVLKQILHITLYFIYCL